MARSGLNPHSAIERLTTLLKRTAAHGDISNPLYSSLDEASSRSLLALSVDRLNWQSQPNVDKGVKSLLSEKQHTLVRVLPRQRAFEIPTILGFRIEGDEACEGPFYNYARIFTWTRASETILNIFSKAVESQVGQSYAPHLNASIFSGSKDLVYMDAYSELHDIDKSVWQRILIATATSMMVPLGTSGLGNFAPFHRQMAPVLTPNV